MGDLRDLYQEVILDHSKAPRNLRAMEGADRMVEGHNPLCGDRLTLYVKFDGDRVADVSFLGDGCAISKASASMMTAGIKGKSREEIEAIFHRFHAMVTARCPAEASTEGLGKLAVFSGVCEYPVRVKCASLAWHTLMSALEGSGESVTTE